MSESGEMSEFGYIMDLLARGKVSAQARGAAAWTPLSGTTWPGSVGIPVIPGRGLGSQVYALSSCSMQNSLLFFIARHLRNEPRGNSQCVWGQPGDGRGLPGRRRARSQRAKMGRRVGRWPRGLPWTHPGLPKRGDFEWATSCPGTERGRRVAVAGELAGRAGLAWA